MTLTTNHRWHLWNGLRGWMWQPCQVEIPVTNRKLDITTALRSFQFDASLIQYFIKTASQPGWSLSLSISISIWQRANVVAESKNSFSLSIYIKNLWFWECFSGCDLLDSLSFLQENDLFIRMCWLKEASPTLGWLPVWALPGQALACCVFNLLSQGSWKIFAV